MNEPLPRDCIGIRLKYKPNIEMVIIDQNPTHILCQFDDGSKICFGRDKFGTDDIVSYPNKVIIKEPKLF